MNLFEDLRSSSPSAKTLADVRDEVSFQKLTEYQAIRTDYQVYGLSTRGHPMKELRQYFSKKVPSVTTGAVRNAQVGRVLRIAGLTIVRQRPPNAKGTCFGTLEDEEGFSISFFTMMSLKNTTTSSSMSLSLSRQARCSGI